MPSRPAGSTSAVSLAALIAFLLAIMPVFFAYLTVPEGYVFGGFLFNPTDGNSYLAKMYSGWNGSWVYTFPYTAQEMPGAYLFLFYIFLGWLARGLGLPLLVVYHLARALSTALLLVFLLGFFRRCLPGPRSASLAFILAALGSGVGWLAVPAGGVTTDFWVPEAYPFLSAYATPHFSLGLALLVGLLGLFLSPVAASPIRSWLLAAAGACLLAVLSPFGVMIVLAVGSAWLAWEGAKTFQHLGLWRNGAWKDDLGDWLRGRRAPLGTLVAVLLGGGPLLVYYAWLPGSDPVIGGWHAQNITPTPPLWDLLLAFSPALLLALPGLRRAGQAESSGPRLLAVWLLVGFFLVVLPLGLQRRFLMGLFVPAAGLAGWSLASLAEQSGRGWKRLAWLALLLPLPTLLLVILAGWHGVQTLDPRFYLTQAEHQALSWLETNAQPQSVVLASPEMGLFIPAYTGLRVIYGHPFETVDASAEEAALLALFAAAPDDPSTCRFISERGIEYVFWGEREQSLGGLPAACLPTNPVYSAGEVMIFRVER